MLLMLLIFVAQGQFNGGNNIEMDHGKFDFFNGMHIGHG